MFKSKITAVCVPLICIAVVHGGAQAEAQGRKWLPDRAPGGHFLSDDRNPCYRDGCFCFPATYVHRKVRTMGMGRVISWSSWKETRGPGPDKCSYTIESVKRCTSRGQRNPVWQSHWNATTGQMIWRKRVRNKLCVS